MSRGPEWSREAEKLVLDAVLDERERQQVQWGAQTHPDGTGAIHQREDAAYYRRLCDDLAALGKVSWWDILREEFHEAGAESDPALLRKELLEVAAICVAWVRDLDSRGKNSP